MKCEICGSNLDFEEFCKGDNAHAVIRDLRAKLAKREKDNETLIRLVNEASVLVLRYSLIARNMEKEIEKRSC